MSYNLRIEEAEIEKNPYATTPTATQLSNRVTVQFLDFLKQKRYHTSFLEEGLYVRDR